jgi:polyisoprenoid-binding protein YceI
MKNTYQIDAAHSSVQFKVRHLMVSNVRGRFTGVKGTVVYDPAVPEQTAVEATIDVNTLSTHDEKRDAHLKTADFFDAAQYPIITFKSTSVEGSGSGSYTVTGDLTMRGETKEVTLVVEDVSEQSKDPWGNSRIGASAKSKLKRSDFGLTWNSALETGGVVIGDDINLEFDLELVKTQSAAV